MDVLDVLAKPDVPLIKHSSEVVQLAQKIAKILIIENGISQRAILACAFHDIGKSTHSFQKFVRKETKKAYPHALASLPFIMLVESILFDENLLATAAVLTHHSPFTPMLYKGFESSSKEPDYLDKEIIKKLLAQLLQEINMRLPNSQTVDEITQQALTLGKNPAAILDTQITYQDGDTETIRLKLMNLPIDDFSNVKAILQLSDWLVSSSSLSVRNLFLGKSNAWIEKIKSTYNLRNFQRKVLSSPGYVLWLKAPTGTGKTEALLLWARDSKKLIYLLPTQATVNAMWKRLAKLFGKRKVSISHGMSGYLLRSQEKDEQEYWNEKLLAKVFGKPVTVATLDQFLLAHLNTRHWEIQRTLIRNSTVIIDEIHCYDGYTLGLLSQALEFEKPLKIAFASATMPEFLKNILPQGQEIEAEKKLWNRRRHFVELVENPLEDCVDEILRYANQGKNVLVVCNTVKKAQQMYQNISQRYRKVKLLHARFIYKDRLKKERHLIENQNKMRGVILVSTQVVEVSLNISFDVLFTQIAPIDALVQRLGRVNRFPSRSNQAAPVFVSLYEDEDSKRIYDAEILQESRQITMNLPKTPTEREWAEAADQLYKAIWESQTFQQEFNEGKRTLYELRKMLGCYTIDLRDEDMRRRFSTRKGQLSIDVLPAKFFDEARKLMETNQSWQIVEYLVPVPIGWLYAYKDWFQPISDLSCFQVDLEYDQKLGLLPPSKDKMPSNMEIL
ncbi:CRISPR-associated helicase/endonuclease Cas3 [Pseudothermotoga thermarum]|uniref:CRISPR-associated helicase Cas3 n=1 Tax=Pseudothermotoga thermarum DSM 5069 TaxID=688269 RepID=F7YTL1_9THEM|nr:CRISPR-associated helicase/endonuclease Cas3 [Pseudothermotoga thermarum]AEH51233.1 CRISPR-associated helicase Cas3 [Pseudothermotoga thermarum DSM 5069]